MYCSQILLGGGGGCCLGHISGLVDKHNQFQNYIYILLNYKSLNSANLWKKVIINLHKKKSGKKKSDWNKVGFFLGGGGRGRGPNPSSGRPAAYDLFWFLFLDHIDERQKAKGDLFLFYSKHCFESKCITKLKRKNKLGSHCTNDICTKIIDNFLVTICVCDINLAIIFLFYCVFKGEVE